MSLFSYVFAFCLFFIAVWAGAATPWQANTERQNGLNNGRIFVELPTEDQLPVFAFDPMIGDLVRGHSGQWYRVGERRFEDSRFTLRLEKIDR